MEWRALKGAVGLAVTQGTRQNSSGYPLGVFSKAPLLSSVTSRENNNFNLIRLMLASSVLVSHGVLIRDGNANREILTSLFHSLTLGHLAVNGFFILSGFLIVGSWVQRPILREFLVKRALRIVPGFVVAFLLSVVVVGFLGGGFAFWRELQPLPLLRSLVTLNQPITPPVFRPNAFPLINSSMWTIPYEVRCYLLVALLGMFGLFAVPKKLFLCLVAGFMFLFGLQRSGIAPHLPLELAIFAYPAFFRMAICFFCGSFFYIFREHIVLTHWRVIVAALMLCGALWVLGRVEVIATSVGTAIPFAFLIFWFAGLQTPFLQKTRAWPDLSYGVYLYGWPIQKITLFYFPTVSPLALLLPQFVLALLCGALSWYGVEKPALSWKPRVIFPASTA